MSLCRLPGLQSLRALAALMVLIGHALAEAEHYFALSLPGDTVPWTRGVDIFFVISGFVITLSAQRFEGSPGAFLWRRFWRVAPLYYLFTTLMVVSLLLLPGEVKDTALDPGQILSSYGFYPYARGDGRIAPVLSLGWTLNYEMFFYALMALCLSLPRPILGISALLVALAVAGRIVAFEAPQWTFWTNPLMLEFLFGIGLARLWMRGWIKPSAILCVVCVSLGSTLLIALDPLPLPRFVAAGVPASLIVAGGALFYPWRRAPGQLLGDASYALYLSHRFALRGATLLVLPLLPPTTFGALIYLLTVCAVSIGIGVLTHLAVERPLMRTGSPHRQAVHA